MTIKQERNINEARKPPGFGVLDVKCEIGGHVVLGDHMTPGFGRTKEKP